MRIIIYGMAIITLLGASPAGHADVFKCTAEDGSITFQQTPCPKQKVEKVRTQTATDSAAVCSFASRFAVSTARLMREGVQSNEVFSGYGGLDSLSRASIGVINYVFSFRTNDDVSVERIAGLAAAKCKVGSFGDASCAQLPMLFTESIGGCDGDGDGLEEGAMAASQVGADAPAAAQARSFAPVSSGSGRSQEEVLACKQHYRDEIDEIDAEMRNGYSSEQGEVYRLRLRLLSEKLRAC